MLGTILGAFQDDEIPGKIQLGSAWWFCDTDDGMYQQMKTLARLGLLGNFIGMLTDSRSFLSYTRHEVRRVRGGVAARAAVLAGGLGGGALLGVAVHTGLHQRADRRHRLALALILGRRQQRLLRCRDGRGV